MTDPMDANGGMSAGDAAGETVAAIAQAQTISAGTYSLAFRWISGLMSLPDEIALYDRQIRLWGVKAQEK
jgi:ubiquitin-like 1-activating enzyme E1 A